MVLNNFNPRPHCNLFNVHIMSNGVISASVALCEGRHDIPEARDGAIFHQIEDPSDIPALERHAASVIKATHVNDLTVYVTGLTQALAATLNACRVYGVTVTLMHYNSATGKYVSQPMI